MSSTTVETFTSESRSSVRPPRWVACFTPVARLLLRFGLPLGANALVTIPGRKTGVPRTTPLAIVAADGRRWVWAPWGDVHWVRNLRAAGRATLTRRGVAEDVRAAELDPDERVAFFRDVLPRVAASVPFGAWFVRTVDGVDFDDPAAAAQGWAVFELLAPGGLLR